MKKIVSAPKTMLRFSEFPKISFVLVFQSLDGYTTVEPLINTIIVVPLEIFCCRSKYNRNGAILGKRGVLRLSYLLNEFGDPNIFVFLLLTMCNLKNYYKL